MTDSPATVQPAASRGDTLSYAAPVLPFVGRLPAVLAVFGIVAVIAMWLPISSDADISIAGEFGRSFPRAFWASRGDALATLAICWPLVFAPVAVLAWALLPAALRHRPAVALAGWFAAASAIVAPVASASALLGFSQTARGVMWAFLLVIPMLIAGGWFTWRLSRRLGPACGVPSVLSLAYASTGLIVLLLTVPESFQPFGHGILFIATALSIVNVIVLYRSSRSISH